MTTRHKTQLAETLETCRPTLLNRPNILKALLAVQSARGHVPTNVIPQIAQVLGVKEAQIVGVLSYYSDLRTQPPGRHLIRVCMGESCTANHGARVFRALQEYVRVTVGDRTQADRFTVEPDVLRGKLRGVADRDDRRGSLWAGDAVRCAVTSGALFIDEDHSLLSCQRHLFPCGRCRTTCRGLEQSPGDSTDSHVLARSLFSGADGGARDTQRA